MSGSPAFPESPGPLRLLLEGIARAGIGIHGALYDRGILPQRRAPIPVISVGNLTVGGTGKTPCVVWLAGELERRGFRPAILSRGHGRRDATIHRVVAGSSTIDQAGDEPLEMARALPRVPVVVGRDRRAAARVALDGGDIGCLILDDGFQHRPLHRDFDLVLLDAARPFGNGHLLPAGPLREPPEALRRAREILLTRADRVDDLDAVRRAVAAVVPDAWISAAVHEPAGLEPLGIGVGTLAAGSEVVVAAGVADPAGVADTVRRLNLSPGEVVAFPDHHRFTEADRARVESVRNGRPVVTTGKDAVRWRELSGVFEDWWIVRIRFRPLEEDRLIKKISGVLSEPRRTSAV